MITDINQLSMPIDWNNVSKYEILSESFIMDYKYDVNWILIFKHQTLSESFINDYQTLSENIIQTNISNLFQILNNSINPNNLNFEESYTYFIANNKEDIAWDLLINNLQNYPTLDEHVQYLDINDSPDINISTSNILLNPPVNLADPDLIVADVIDINDSVSSINSSITQLNTTLTNLDNSIESFYSNRILNSKNINESKRANFVIRAHQDIIWTLISKHQILSESFIRNNDANINWLHISKYQILSEILIIDFIGDIDWHYICKYQRLSTTFMTTYQDQIDWNFVSRYQVFNNNFIITFQSKIDFRWLYMHNPHVLTRDFYDEFKDLIF